MNRGELLEETGALILHHKSRRSCIIPWQKQNKRTYTWFLSGVNFFENRDNCVGLLLESVALGNGS